MLSEEYIAGFFDGEGCVTINTSTATHKSGNRYPSTVMVCVSQNDINILRLIQNRCGGKLLANSTHKRHHILQWYGNKAGSFLELVYPHLQVKKKQAEVALLFLKLKRGKPLSELNIAERQKLKVEIDSLKRD